MLRPVAVDMKLQFCGTIMLIPPAVQSERLQHGVRPAVPHSALGALGAYLSRLFMSEFGEFLGRFLEYIFLWHYTVLND